MTQLSIFDRVHFPRHHTNDPRSSVEAAAKVEASGSAKRKAMQILGWSKKYPNSTARELWMFANQPHLDLMDFRRRLGELARCGAVDAVLTPDTKPCQFAGSRDTRYTAR